MCVEGVLAVFLALMAVNAELTYWKEKRDVRRYHLEICNRQLASDNRDHCAGADRLACQSFHDVAIPEQSADAQAHEAAREKA